MTTPLAPTLSGFISWAQTAMGISTDVLPVDSMWYVYAYDIAVCLVNQTLNCVAPTIYTLAVYNLGGSNLVNYAQDAVGAPIYKNKLPFFAYLRNQFNCNGFTPGVVTSASDEGTSDSLIVPEFMETLTLADLQYLKDPWGRQYLAFAMRFGPLWGVS